MKKRILSCLMALALCLTLLPATALAEDGHAPHCLCGAEHTSIGDHKESIEITFDKWLASSVSSGNRKLLVGGTDQSTDGDWINLDSNDKYVLSSGNYYLKTGNSSDFEANVKVDHPIQITGIVTICLNGQTIESDAKGMPVFEVASGGKLTLTDCRYNKGKVTHFSDGTGSGVEVNGGIFNMYGGTITDNTADNGGVCVNSGAFNMYGGTITGNTAPHGGGVYVNGGTFTMDGNASVTKNIANSSTGTSGGVYVVDGTFTMNSGTISGNEADLTDGGVGVYNTATSTTATFNMNGGEITRNKASSSGGVGVYGSNATFNMKGGTIGGATVDAANTATYKGGGVYVKNGGTFTMNDTASVTGNTAKQGNGGGVYVDSGKFNMNGSASIKSNKTVNNDAYGGGVYVIGEKSTFEMNGTASITDNTAPNGGGGVYVNSGKFNMNGNASIKSNTASGVFVSADAFFTVSGEPTVTGNTGRSAAENDVSNVFLASDKTITIGKNGLSGNASIGVTRGAGSTIATGINALTAEDAKKFKSDKAGFEVSVDTKNNQLVLTNSSAPAKHTHIWTYKAENATITATCTGKGNCDFNNNGGSVTITKPDDLTQGSNGKTATVTVSDNWKGPDVSKITITYWKSVDGGNTYRNLYGVVPTEVGKYKASITVKDATASVVYNIVASTTGKKEQDQLILKSTKETLAIGDTLTLSVDGGNTKGAVTYRITDGTGKATIKGNVLTAEKAGTVMVTATMAGNDTYNAVTSGPLTITITETTGGTTPSQPGGSSSGGSGSYDSNPIIKTETKNNPDGSTTKTETRKDCSVTQTTTGKDGSTGTVKTDKNGKTEMNAKLSDKAVEDAKKSGEPVKAPVEVEASRNSGTAPTVKVELPQNSGKTEVEIPVSNANAGTVAVLVHADGTEEILKASVPTENGIRLTVDGSATVKIIDNSKDFVDTRNHWAREEIDFVSARELVNGMSATRYAPDASATRAQLWTILARQNDANLSGGNTWYEKAQLWSKDKGISDGTNPGAAINRAQMVTMLWRTMGQPAAGGAANFNDVPANSYYAQAVAWAVEGGITQGVGGDRFDPNATCTRAQIAAFLARSMK